MIRILVLLVAALLATACSPPARLRVLVHLPQSQQENFRNRVLKPFEKKHGVVVEMKAYDDPTALPDLLASSRDTFDLVNPPLEMTRPLAARDLVATLEEFVPAKVLADVRREFFLMDLPNRPGRTCFLPRFLETPVLIYLKSQVAEAVMYWEIRKDEIDRALARYNGHGLPTGYALEKDPSKWDTYDLFVAGYYWSQKEVQGQRRGRMSLGPQDGPGLAAGLMDKGFQAGAGPDGVLRMGDAPIVDMFQWQSVLIREGVVNPGLVRNAWGTDRILSGFRSGEIHLAVGTQTDAFALHGNGTRELPGLLRNPEDMGIAPMPKGVSLQLDARGLPAREGGRSVATRTWWWAVTRESPDKALAFKLARHLGGTRSQIEEGTVFGAMPARHDLLGELDLVFGGGWTSEVFQVASHQIVENRFTVPPLIEEYPEVARNYAAAYREICLPGPGQKTALEDVRRALEERFVPQQRRILGGRYPGGAISSANVGNPARLAD